jgi:hypothetical protein
VPYLSCPTCRLASYAVAPHSGHPLCPHCDAELFPSASRVAVAAPEPASPLAADADGAASERAA